MLVTSASFCARRTRYWELQLDRLAARELKGVGRERTGRHEDAALGLFRDGDTEELADQSHADLRRLPPLALDDHATSLSVEHEVDATIGC